MTINLSAVIAKIEQVFTITDELTTQEIADAVKASLYIEAVKWKLQQRKNIFTRQHLSPTTIEYRTRNGLSVIGVNVIEEADYTSVYLSNHPDNTLEGDTLTQAAKTEWIAEMNSIDAEINSAKEPMMLTPLSAEWTALTNLSNAVKGVDTDIKNLLKAAVQIDWK